MVAFPRTLNIFDVFSKYGKCIWRILLVRITALGIRNALKQFWLITMPGGFLRNIIWKNPMGDYILAFILERMDRYENFPRFMWGNCTSTHNRFVMSRTLASNRWRIWCEKSNVNTSIFPLIVKGQRILKEHAFLLPFFFVFTLPSVPSACNSRLQR